MLFFLSQFQRAKVQTVSFVGPWFYEPSHIPHWGRRQAFANGFGERRSVKPKGWRLEARSTSTPAISLARNRSSVEDLPNRLIRPEARIPELDLIRPECARLPDVGERDSGARIGPWRRSGLQTFTQTARRSLNSQNGPKARWKLSVAQGRSFSVYAFVGALRLMEFTVRGIVGHDNPMDCITPAGTGK